MDTNFNKAGHKENIFLIMNPPKASKEHGIPEHDESKNLPNKKSTAEYKADKIKGCYKESILELIQKAEKHPPNGDTSRF